MNPKFAGMMNQLNQSVKQSATLPQTAASSAVTSAHNQSMSRTPPAPGLTTSGSPIAPPPTEAFAKIDWLARVDEVAPRIASRAAEYDATDGFVAEDYVDLKAARFFSAGVPGLFGGGEASYTELCEIVRKLAHSNGSTALALSMHYHLVAALVWRYKHMNAPLADFLKRLAREELVLVSSGGSDWLNGSGRAEPVESGYLVTARKIFSSGCPAGDLLMTTAVTEDPQSGPTVLHFPVALNSPKVKIIPTWRTLGMRGTGSHDVMIEGVFVPAASVSVRRPRGRWHPAMHAISKIALPMVYSAYVGLAEAARMIALREAQSKKGQPEAWFLAGEMDSELFNARLGWERMVDIGANRPPGPDTTNAVLMARALTAQSCIRAVEKAVELVGGRSFYRDLGLERIYRDVQAARFHPMPEKPQQQFTGRLALGLDLDV